MVKAVYDWRTDPTITKHSLAPRDVYLAAPFFNTGQEMEIVAVEQDLMNAGLSFFSPRLECRYVKGAPNARALADKAYFLNVRHLGLCTFVLAGLTFPDVGTAWELGYAQALKVPRLGYTSRVEVLSNLMICKTVDAMTLTRRLRTALGSIYLDIRERSRGIDKAILAVNDTAVYDRLPEE